MIVLAVIAVLYFLFVILTSFMARFGTLKTGEAPSLFGMYFRSITVEGAKEEEFFGDVLISVKVSQDEALALEEDEIVFYLCPGVSTAADPVLAGRIVEAKVTGERSVMYSIREFGGENALYVPALMVEERWTGKCLWGMGRLFDFLFSRTGYLVTVTIPVSLILTGVIAGFILKAVRKKKAN